MSGSKVTVTFSASGPWSESDQQLFGDTIETTPPEHRDTGFPIQDRCGCGWQPLHERARYHRRGDPEKCRAEAT